MSCKEVVVVDGWPLMYKTDKLQPRFEVHSPVLGLSKFLFKFYIV